MTKKTDSKDILSVLNKILIEALSSKESYKTKYQEYLITFIDNYDTKLNKNSKPLFDFFKKLDNVEKLKVNLWLKSNTSLKGVTVSDKGCKITFKEGYESLQVFNKNLLWYDMKIEVKPYEPSSEKLKKSLMNLLKHYEKQAIKDILNTL